MVQIIIFNFLIISLFVLSSSSVIHDDDNELPLYAPGIRIINYEPSEKLSNRLTRSVRADPIEPDTPKCDATTIGPKCANDCSTLMYCAGGGTSVYEDKCENMDPNKPYCVNGTCSAAPDVNNDKCQSSFLCTSVGTFPDPFDCTKFHNCVDMSKPAESYMCPPTYTYMSTNKICTRTITCQKFTCPTSATGTGIVTYTYDKAYYGYCFQKPGGAKSIVMYKCPNEIDYIYDDKTGVCKFNCKTSANYIDRGNCNNYVSCYLESGVYKSIILPCPVGYYFDSVKSACTPGTCTY